MSRKLLLLVVATWLVVLVQSSVILRDENEVDDEEEIDLSHLGMDIYGEPDEKVGELVENYDPKKDLVNPEELGSYVEGDILINRPAGRNGLADKSTRWPSGVVPFVIKGNFQAREMQLIEDAFNEYHRKTCVRFVPRMGERDYISIENGNSGCWSSVGRTGGMQQVNLQMPGCTTKVGTIVHELMHALGFMHEQNRYERDDWVRIQTQNVQRGTENNFAKASVGSTDGFGVQYDYGSVMHYSANAFSTNGQPTIVAKRSTNGATMGQREGFSPSDVAKINRMYGCNDETGPSPPISLPFPIPAPPYPFIGGEGLPSGVPSGPNNGAAVGYPSPYYPGYYGYYYPNSQQGYYPGGGFGGAGAGNYPSGPGQPYPVGGYPQGPGYPSGYGYGGPYYPYDEKTVNDLALVEE